MRIINLIVVHCSATRGDSTLSPEALDLMHRRRGFNGNGEIEPEEWIKQCPCFGVAKEFGEFATITKNMEKHRVTQQAKEQKGGKLWQ